MGKYFNPTTKKDVQDAGGILLQPYKATYNECKRLLGDGKVLVGRFNRGFFHVMPLLHNEEEFKEFMSQYNAGHLLSYEFYAMPSSVFDIAKTSSTSASTVASVAASTVAASTASSVAASTAASTVASSVVSTATNDAAGAASSVAAADAAADAASSVV
jgi:hypothetical protein